MIPDAELPHGVHPLKMPMPSDALVPDSTLEYTLCYLLQTEEGWGLIDTGWNHEAGMQAFLKRLQALRLKPVDIRWILVTHFHPDHIGLAQRIKEISRARVVMHVQDSPSTFRARLQAVGRSFTQRFEEWLRSQGMPAVATASIPMMRNPPASFLPDLDVDVQVEGDADLSPSLKLIWTPGHTPGHLCLHDTRRRLLFSGDQVLPGITTNVSLFPLGPDNPLGDYLASLHRLETIEVEWVLPAHEHPFKGLRTRLGELERHHTSRLEETLSTLKGGPRTAYQVARQVGWSPGPWDSMSPSNRLMALFETLAHLRYLVRHGTVEEVKQNSVVVYALRAG